MVAERTHEGHWAIILGASKGLGLATAKKLASHGMNLCLVYREKRSEISAIEKIFDTIKKDCTIEIVYHNMDAMKEDNRKRVLAHLKETAQREGIVKVLVHSIAKGNLKPMLTEEGATLKNDDFRLTINSMAISLYDWTKDIVSHNLFSKDARIISFTSEGNTKAWPHYAAVSAAKVALEAITRSIALEFAPLGIKANCIQAGVTDTASFRMIPGSDLIRENTLLRNPNKRMTTPEDVAAVVYLLTRDEAKWITGTIIPVDGGEHLS